jgi:adenosylcobinamide-GDP ribazoletransferase
MTAPEPDAPAAAHDAPAAAHDAPTAEPDAPAAAHDAPTPEPDAPAAEARWVRDAALAVGLLTILPVPIAGASESDLGRTALWFPLVGALVGGLAGGVRVVVAPLLGPLPATAIALIVLIAGTGALHQDGLADSADGIGAGGDAPRRLAAMRDSAIGAFGVLALLWWGLVLLTTVGSLTDVHALQALVVAGAVSRWAAVAHAARTPAARTDGLGAAFDVGWPRLAGASVLAVVVAEAAGGVLAGLLALAAGLLTAALSVVWAQRSLGGRTGDTLGATVAVAEMAVCVGLLALWRT